MRIKKVNVTEQVVEYLKENIEAGNWKVGEKIPSENQMTSTLGVSRSSVRAALQYMIGIGVLESVHGKGTYLINSQVENWEEADNKITSEDCKDIEKVLEFRRILEPDACRLAVERGDSQVVSELETRKNHNQMNALFGFQSGIDCHTEILEAFKEKNSQKAYRAMWNHMNQAMKKI